jgi:hypothetical protein
MRRVVRRIFTVVTFERWSLNWEKGSKEETGSEDGSEQLIVEVKGEPSQRKRLEGKMFGEKKEE